MDKVSFLNTRLSREHVLHVLQDPKTVDAVYRYLEYTNGGSLPSSGVIAGQSVSTAIDYHLGLRDRDALVIKDIDHFDHVTFHTVQHTSSWKKYLAATLAEHLFDRYIISPGEDILLWSDSLESELSEAVSLKNRGVEQEALAAELMLATKVFAPAVWETIMKMLPCRFEYRGAYFIRYLASRLFPIITHTHPQMATLVAKYSDCVHRDVLGKYDSPHHSVYSLFRRFCNADCHAFDMPIDTSWSVTQHLCDYDGLNSLRFNEIVRKGSLTAEYGIMGILPNSQAVQPVLTSEVLLYGNVLNVDNNGAIEREYAGGTSLERMQFGEITTRHNAAALTSDVPGYAWGVVAGFDINNVQVGLDLNAMQLVFTERYVDFLTTRELLVTSAQTPMLSVVRALDKAKQLPVYLNKARIVRYGQAFMARRLFQLDTDSGFDAVSGKLQQVYDQVRKTPDLARGCLGVKFASVLIGKGIAARAERHPEISETFTTETLSNGACVFVPRKAEAWQSLLCATQHGTTAQGTSLVTYLSASPFNTAVTVQFAEMNARWKQRTQRILKLIAVMENKNLTLSLSTDSLYQELQSMLKNVLRRKFTVDQAIIMDTDDFQPVLQLLAEHMEMRTRLPITPASLRWMADSIKIAHQQAKPVQQWVARMQAELAVSTAPHLEIEARAQRLQMAQGLALQFITALRQNLHLPRFDFYLKIDSGAAYLNQFFVERLNLKHFTPAVECLKDSTTSPHTKNPNSMRISPFMPLYAESSISPANLKWYDKVEEGHSLNLRDAVMTGNNPPIAHAILSNSYHGPLYQFAPLMALWPSATSPVRYANGCDAGFGGIAEVLYAIQDAMAPYANNPDVPNFEYFDRDGQFRAIPVDLLVSDLLIWILRRFEKTLHNMFEAFESHLNREYPRFMACQDVIEYLNAVRDSVIPAMPETLTPSSAIQRILDVQLAVTAKAAALYYIKQLNRILEDKTANVIPLDIQEALANTVKELNEDPANQSVQFSAVELLSQTALSFEGHRMRHCVGGYFDSVNANRCRILTFSVTIGDAVHRGTAEWVRSSVHQNNFFESLSNSDPFIIRSQQLRGPLNNTPHPLITKLHDKLIQHVNNQPDRVWQIDNNVDHAVY